MAGSDTIVEQIDRALETPDVAALVLRVNSPGGSVFASEVIRQKVLEVKAMDMPVVVSMGVWRHRGLLHRCGRRRNLGSFGNDHRQHWCLRCLSHR